MAAQDQAEDRPERKRGSFPFPLRRSMEESDYLVWLRNHSNYMVSQGFVDYLRIGAVLLRGILLNLLVITPFLLIVAMVVALLYGPQLRQATVHWTDFATYSLQSSPQDSFARFSQKLNASAQRTASTAADEIVVRPVDLWLFSKLSDETLEIWKSIEWRTEQKPQLRALIVRDVHVFLGDPNVHRALPFRSFNFSDGLDALLDDPDLREGKLSSHEVRRINRRLLTEVFISDGDAKEQLLRGVHFNGGWLYDHMVEANVHDIMPRPYTLTLTAIITALVIVLFSPVLRMIGLIRGQRKNLSKAGSYSSVERRDRFEKYFGYMLLITLSLAAFETLPILVDLFHHFLVAPEGNWNSVFTTVAGGSIAVMGAAHRLIASLSGIAKRLAVTAVGILGILAPLIFVLYVINFLVYPPDVLSDTVALVLVVVSVAAPFVFGLFTLIAIGVGLFKRSLRFKEFFYLVIMACLLFGAVVWVGIISSTSAREVTFAHWGFFLIFALMLLLIAYSRVVMDINWTSIHGLYRDRLASAYLVGVDTRGDVGIEEDINLWEICKYEHGSVAPYHLVNTAINLQNSGDKSLRDRSSDFFVFSKRFIGGRKTGYCRSETLEQVHPEMNLATAMAISAAAASPNMGRSTSGAMVALMVLLNIRLGYWIPNPGLLEERLANRSLANRWHRHQATLPHRERAAPGFTFDEVFASELAELGQRWGNVYADLDPGTRRQMPASVAAPTTELGLIGLAFSGGGIRSATINLGIAQALHRGGVFDHVDYMSSVSGGGYLASSISTLMRSTLPRGDAVEAHFSSFSDPYHHKAQFTGSVELMAEVGGHREARVHANDGTGRRQDFRFARFDQLEVEHGEVIDEGRSLVKEHNSLWDRFKWRVRPSALVSEMLMRLSEDKNWVNLSDGGHIENLATIELLRRRCKYIIIGDGEADLPMAFNGLATLVRYARIDLGIEIEIDTSQIALPPRPTDPDLRDAPRYSGAHWALGRIKYPPRGAQPEETGYLIYLKSSVTGDEDEVIKEYRHRNPNFPHQSTADQFFDEDQFECYRALGQHIAEALLSSRGGKPGVDSMRYEAFCDWIETAARQGE